MILQHYPSRLLEQAVQEFSRLPGIGRKTALRLVLHLLRQDVTDVVRLTDAVATMRREVKSSTETLRCLWSSIRIPLRWI